MTPLTNLSEAIETICDLKMSGLIPQKTESAYHIVVPDKHSFKNITEEIERARPSPSRKKGEIKVHSLESLLKYAENQNATDTGYIYADSNNATITAVFNDHKNENQTGWRDHRVSYTAENTNEFRRWFANNKKDMSQEDFAIFLEDNIADINNGETVLSVALSLQAKTEVNFSSSRRLDNGQVQFSYTENIDARAAGGALDVPREFTLGIRIFKNGEGYAIKARLKYRLNSGKIKFWYELDRVENAIDDAFNGYIEKLKECGYTILLGTP